jgi:hypothetical protein
MSNAAAKSSALKPATLPRMSPRLAASLPSSSKRLTKASTVLRLRPERAFTARHFGLSEKPFGRRHHGNDLLRGRCPTDSADLIELEGQKVAGLAKFQICELPSCRQVFEVGSSSGRRLDARFCSDSHRIEFNSRKRTKGP